MQCRSCGVEIADRAIVCYRCGTSTTAPTHKPYEESGGRSRGRILAAVTATVLLALAAWFLLHS